MEKDRIREIALAAGFQLKEQGDGSMDLHPYVFEFAGRLLATATPQDDEPRLVGYAPNMQTCTLAIRDEKYYFQRECKNLPWGDEQD